MSRAINISLGGSVMVCCIHGEEKGKVKEVLYDVRTMRAAECICCGNCFTYPFNRMDAPVLCPGCDPGRKHG